MARIACTTVVIVLLNVLVGCRTVDSGTGQLMTDGTGRLPPSASIVNVSEVSETDLVEQVTVNRQAYRRGLEMLVGYYSKAGNNMKLQWAKKELMALNTMPKYKYIVEAGAAGPNLRPSAVVPEADALYYEALELERKAGPLPVLKNESLLRLALGKYNELIDKHPSSDKIDDAAYRAGEIYENLNDYSIALMYYQRTYQWDPETSYPARFRSARILDKHLHRNAEALQLYQQAIETEGIYDKYREWKQYAEGRIRALQKIEEGES
jgi:tetratricopeptide (TPR) repeat protein